MADFWLINCEDVIFEPCYLGRIRRIWSLAGTGEYHDIWKIKKFDICQIVNWLITETMVAVTLRTIRWNLRIFFALWVVTLDLDQHI